jgi:hypothetical protein
MIIKFKIEKAGYHSWPFFCLPENDLINDSNNDFINLPNMNRSGVIS